MSRMKIHKTLTRDTELHVADLIEPVGMSQRQIKNAHELKLVQNAVLATHVHIEATFLRIAQTRKDYAGTWEPTVALETIDRVIEDIATMLSRIDGYERDAIMARCGHGKDYA